MYSIEHVTYHVHPIEIVGWRLLREAWLPQADCGVLLSFRMNAHVIINARDHVAVQRQHGGGWASGVYN